MSILFKNEYTQTTLVHSSTEATHTHTYTYTHTHTTYKMTPYYHALIGAAAKIPVPDPKPVISFSPVVLPAKGRPVDLVMRVSIPESGSALPIILLSHGLGYANYISSHYGYTPLSDFYAARGFVVIQPTHLDSHFLGLKHEGGFPWKSRMEDMTRILDELDTIEAAVPTLRGRLDRSRVAVMGHSMGANTAAMLLGATNTHPVTGEVVRARDERIRAGITLSGAGNGGDDVAEHARAMLDFYNPDFGTMTAPTLVVYGDEDSLRITSRKDIEWYADAYTCSPAPKALLRLKGGKHGLGGVSTWDAGETDDESPERLALTQRVTWAYLRKELCDDGASWDQATEALKGLDLGSVETK